MPTAWINDSMNRAEEKIVTSRALLDIFKKELEVLPAESKSWSNKDLRQYEGVAGYLDAALYKLDQARVYNLEKNLELQRELAKNNEEYVWILLLSAELETAKQEADSKMTQ
jgi:hypothetical protein